MSTLRLRLNPEILSQTRQCNNAPYASAMLMLTLAMSISKPTPTLVPAMHRGHALSRPYKEVECASSHLFAREFPKPCRLKPPLKPTVESIMRQAYREATASSSSKSTPLSIFSPFFRGQSLIPQRKRPSQQALQTMLEQESRLRR